MRGSGYLLYSLLIRSLRPYLAAMNLSFFSFFVLFIPELSAHAGYYDYDKLDSFLDIASILIASAFIGSVIFNFIFIGTRAVDIFTNRFGKFWIYGAPGFASFLIFVEIPLRTLAAGSQESIYILIFSGFFLASITLLLYLMPVFSGMNATLIFLGAVFARILMLPFETMAKNIFSFSYLAFQSYILAAVVSFYLLIQMRYRYHLTPYYERFRVPYFIISIAVLLWMVLIFLSWFQFYPYPIPVQLPHIDAQEIMIIKDRLENFPINSLLVGITFWILLSLLTNFNYRSRIRKNSFKLNLFIFIFTLIIFSSAVFRLSRSFPDNENISEIISRKTVSLELLNFAGLLMDRDGDSNSLWPGRDPDDDNSCIRADYICSTERKKSPLLSKQMEEQIDNAKGKKNIILITVGGKLSGTNRRILLRSDSTERNLRALFQEINGMEEISGITERSFISEFAEMGYRTICGGYTGHNGYMSKKGESGLHPGCQIYLADDDLKDYDLADTEFSSVVGAMSRVYKKYSEEYTFLWIHYDSDSSENAEISASDLNSLNFIKNFGQIILIMNPPYAEVRSDNFYEISDQNNFSLRSLVYRYMRYDPYDKKIHSGPTVIEKNTIFETYASQVYRRRRQNTGVLPQQTAVQKDDGSLIITDHLLGIRCRNPPIEIKNEAEPKTESSQ